MLSLTSPNIRCIAQLCFTALFHVLARGEIGSALNVPCKTTPVLTLRLPRCFEESGYRRFPSRRGSPSTAILTTPSGGCVQTRPPASSRIEASFSYSTAVTIMSSSPARSACAIFAPASAYGVMRLHRYCKRHHPAAEPTPAAFPDGGRSIL